MIVEDTQPLASIGVHTQIIVESNPFSLIFLNTHFTVQLNRVESFIMAVRA